MKLSVARELKEVLKAKVRHFAVDAGPSLEAFAAGRAGVMPFGYSRNFTARAQMATAAIGLAPKLNKNNDFIVAVRTGGGIRADQVLSGVVTGENEVDVVEGILYSARAGAGPRTPRPTAGLFAGGSCGHYAISAGSLGGFVEDEERYYILSNNHVLADSDRGFRGDAILAPGPADVVGNDFRVIGALERWIPLRTGTVDAALATFDAAVKSFHPWRYNGIGDMEPKIIDDRFAVRQVTKLGRTTEVTRGIVSVFELDGITVNYGSMMRPYLISFDGQIEITGEDPAKPFSLPGDSGSFILDADTLRPYALLFAGGAGTDGTDRTIGSFMPDVLSQLNVRLIES